jgi:methyltransferase
VKPPLAALALYLALLAIQRAHELRLSARHTRRRLARGAIERSHGHYPLLVALHVAFPLSLLVEVLALGARPPAAWPLWLMALALAQGLRLWAMASLGERWTTGIWVIPGEAPLRRGAYRFLAHPSYLAVTLELLAAPLMFGAWRTAAWISAANAALLAVRIRAEERALRSAGAPAAAPALPRAGRAG